jgi:hypothetical protein
MKFVKNNKILEDSNAEIAEEAQNCPMQDEHETGVDSNAA